MAAATQSAFQCHYLASHSKRIKILWGLILLLVLFVSNSVASKAIVKTLPGFTGELPFVLETGSFSGFAYETGPLEFDINSFKGGFPKLVYYPSAWTKVNASIIFLDSPVGTGFSYSKTVQGWPSSDTASSEQAYQFLRKWLEENPQYLFNPLFIAGDSYSGIIVPLITKLIVEDNEAGLQPLLNLKGYLIGSPTTDEFINSNSKIPFAHRLALISNDLYEKLKSSCNGNYVSVDPSNGGCVTALAEYDECIKDIWTNHILEPNCEFASPQHDVQARERSLEENRRDFVLSPPRIPELWCRAFNYVLSYTWANDPGVQEALHVREGLFLKLTYFDVSLHSGDHDMVVPFVATDTWIRALNLPVVEKWRPWFVDDQVVGYTRKYSENGFCLTYVTVKGAGHTAPEYYRRECYEMFQRYQSWKFTANQSQRNPLTDEKYDFNSRIKFAHRVALLPDELYEETKLDCQGEYAYPNRNDARCIEDLEIVNLCLKDINKPMVLEPKCSFSAKLNKVNRGPSHRDVSDALLLDVNPPRRWCRVDNYLFIYIWANDKEVQEALHVRNGTIQEWDACNKSLSYVGDHDLIFPYVGTEEWIQSLNLTVSSDEEWRPWFVDGQIAGDTAPEYKPKKCFNMIRRWFATYFL
ncbi:Serine carboxypeptidase 18 [Spatholobus suberectus]|nr:Serine carboxypeptidase 18 [Spatholobus suberectus]